MWGEKHTRLSLWCLLSLVTLAGCGSEHSPSNSEKAASVALPSPPPKRELLVTAGVFAVELRGLRDDSTTLFQEIELFKDDRVKSCLLEAGFAEFAKAVDVQFVGVLDANSKFSLVGPAQGSAPVGFAPCLAKILESHPFSKEALPLALSVDVRVRETGERCAGPYCEPALPKPGGPGLRGLGTIGHESGAFNGSIRPTPNPGDAAKVSMGKATVTGKLPPEIVQRIVRAHYGRFRLCYQEALRDNPDLAGAITMKFEIIADGSARNVEAANATINDQEMVSCVSKKFTAIDYPQPEAGTVKVLLPLVFSPPAARPPSTIAGKELASVTAEDLRRVLLEKGWQAFVVPDAATPAHFAIFATKGEQRAVVRLFDERLVQRERPADLWLTSPKATLAAVSLTGVRASELADIVDPR